MNADHESIVDYIIARRDYEEAKARSNEHYRAMKSAEKRMVEAMIESETKAVKRADGMHFIVMPAIGFKATEELFEPTQEWLSSVGEEPEDYILRSTSRKRLRALLKRMLDEGHEVDVPDFLQLDTTPTISVRGWNKDG